MFDRFKRDGGEAIAYVVTGDGETEFVSVFVPGEAPAVAASTHPNYAAILEGAKAGDPSVLALFDIAAQAAGRFERLSERVTARNGRLYLDGEEFASALSSQVVRFLADGVDDWRPLVLFLEAVQANPSAHSRDQLYSWLDAHEFTITRDGMIVAYKGVQRTDEGEFVSIHSGRAIVNGEEHEGHIPNPLGAVVEMPRGDVASDPSTGCSYGLHVGTFEYAKGFAKGAVLEVHVNPRDVVSVPTDCKAAKMRTCRYSVVGVLDAAYASAVIGGAVPLGDGEDDGEGWGEV